MASFILSSILLMVVICALKCLSLEGFQTSQRFIQRKHILNKKLSMVSMDDITSRLTHSIIPICLEATSKTTTFDDPLAGMNPEEIAAYTTNIGGGLCGLPDSTRAIIGIALNLNLLAFGVLVVSYAILNLLTIGLSKQIEDEFEDEDRRLKRAGEESIIYELGEFAEVYKPNPFDRDFGRRSDEEESKRPFGENRETRRLRQRLDRKKNT